ncbi:MAG: molybdenum cofactor guanylyltransferase [Solirubrobacterales bacterium]|nr:molybdenum cofactor guanylyltransferase [Solirubrobacterales bacterium]
METDHEVEDSSTGVGAAVLAGGAGSRLGGDKALVQLGGRMLVEYPVEALREAGLSPFVVTKASHPVDLPGVETVIEPPTPQHPLLGIVTALEAAEGGPVLVVACDLPLLPPDLLRWIADQSGDPVVPFVAGQLQPLVARYGPDSLEVLEDGLTSGRSMKATVMDLDPVIVRAPELDRFGDPDRIFHNVNSRTDLEWAEGLLGAGWPARRGSGEGDPSDTCPAHLFGQFGRRPAATSDHPAGDRRRHALRNCARPRRRRQAVHRFHWRWAARRPVPPQISESTHSPPSFSPPFR